MTNLFRNIGKIFSDAAAGIRMQFQRQALIEFSLGVNATRTDLDRMSEKGWKITIDETAMQRPVFVSARYGGLGGAAAFYSFINYTAEKDGHKKCSAAWYRDLCDVLGYSPNAIPPEALQQGSQPSPAPRR